MWINIHSACLYNPLWTHLVALCTKRFIIFGEKLSLQLFPAVLALETLLVVNLKHWNDMVIGHPYTVSGGSLWSTKTKIGPFRPLYFSVIGLTHPGCFSMARHVRPFYLSAVGHIRPSIFQWSDNPVVVICQIRLTTQKRKCWMHLTTEKTQTLDTSNHCVLRNRKA